MSRQELIGASVRVGVVDAYVVGVSRSLRLRT